MNAALFIETRQLPRLYETIQGHLDMLPNDYELIIYHGRLNKHLFDRFNCEKNEISLHSLNDYNNFLTSFDLWGDLIRFNNVLIFQSDSGILRKGIEEFYGYSFIGAPIYHIPFPCMNGGLSLRDTKQMHECLYDPHFRFGNHNEDILFCKSCERLGFKLPDIETAKKFSVETIFNLGSFGYHAPNKYLNDIQLKKLMYQYK